jgi:hypothetical protein
VSIEIGQEHDRGCSLGGRAHAHDVARTPHQPDCVWGVGAEAAIGRQRHDTVDGHARALEQGDARCRRVFGLCHFDLRGRGDLRLAPVEEGEKRDARVAGSHDRARLHELSRHRGHELAAWLQRNEDGLREDGQRGATGQIGRGGNVAVMGDRRKWEKCGQPDGQQPAHQRARE